MRLRRTYTITQTHTHTERIHGQNKLQVVGCTNHFNDHETHLGVLFGCRFSHDNGRIRTVPSSVRAGALHSRIIFLPVSGSDAAVEERMNDGGAMPI